MRITPERAVLTVAKHDGQWAVELEGEYFGHSADKEETKATATKKARQMFDDGKPCQVRVSGENFFG